MKTVPDKRTQNGFTMVEIVAATVIATILAAYAIPRMMSASDVAAKVTADRVLAAMYIAQTLAQRQGMATGVEVTSAKHLLVLQNATAVSFQTHNYDGTDTGGFYDVLLPPDVTIPAINIAYGSDGIPTSGVTTYTIAHGTSDRFTIRLEPTGFAHFE